MYRYLRNQLNLRIYLNKRIGGTDGCFPKACNNGMCSIGAIFYENLMQLQEIPQETMSRLIWHYFTMGSVRAVPCKDVTHW